MGKTVTKKLIVLENPDKASPEREACISCLLFQSCSSPFMKAYIPKGWTGKYLFVGEGPGKHEDEVSYRPFSGAAGKLFVSYLFRAGYRKVDCAFSNAVRCRPINNATPSTAQIKSCRPFVLYEIEHYKPEYVILLGKTAANSILGRLAKGNLGLLRGRDFTIERIKHKPKVIVTYHPAVVLRGGGQYESSILEDLARPGQANLQLPKDGFPKASRVGFDTEYYFRPSSPIKPVAITVAISDSKEVKVYDKEEVKKARLGSILPVTLCGHAIEHDLDCLTALGEAREDWLRGENVLDSLLLARMENENKIGKGEYKLETLFLQNFKAESWKAETEIYGNDPRKWPTEERKRRCGLDAWASYMLCRKFSPNIRGPIIFNHRVAQTLHRVYLAGAVVNLNTWGKLKRTYTREVNHLREGLTRLAHSKGMTEFSPTNDNHIRELVYRRLRCPILNRTEKTNLPAVDKITLGQFQNKNGVKELLAFSKADKILSTYLLSLSELWSPLDSSKALLRFRLIPLGARTTRRASAKPNSQNWPDAVRGIIVSRFKGGKIVSFDYSKLEPLLMAWEAGDEKMFDFFYNGNGYIDIAKELWGKTVDENSTEYRTTKSISLGVNYDLQSPNMAKKLYQELGIRFAKRWDDHVHKTDEYRRRYLGMFPGLKRYIQAREEELLKFQGVNIATGAFRHLPCLQGRDTEGFWHLRKEAINAPIQGLAAAVTGSAMIDCEEALLKEHKLSYVDYQTALLNSPKEELHMPLLINEVHDELVYDVPGDQVERAKDIIVTEMGCVNTFRRLVPNMKFEFKVKTAISNQWGKS